MDSLYPQARSKRGIASVQEPQVKKGRMSQPYISTRNSARPSRSSVSSQIRIDQWDKDTTPARLTGNEKDPARLLGDFIHREVLFRGKDPSCLLGFSSWELNVRFKSERNKGNTLTSCARFLNKRTTMTAGFSSFISQKCLCSTPKKLCTGRR